MTAFSQKNSEKKGPKIASNKENNKRGSVNPVMQSIAATLTLELNKLRQDFFMPARLHNEKISFSLGETNYHEGHLELAQKDMELITEVFQKHPKEVVEIVNLLSTSDLQSAHEKAKKIGLTEIDIQCAGGGAFGLLFLLAVAVVIILLPGNAPGPTAKQRAQCFETNPENRDVLNQLRR